MSLQKQAGIEDGLGGISDDHQFLCFAFAFWNKKDPIIKERIFGLTGNEGNHGEDAKEYWWYLDSTPTHSYMRWRIGGVFLRDRSGLTDTQIPWLTHNRQRPRQFAQPGSGKLGFNS